MELKIALAGNPNCGKTTLFNDLTGSSQYVGNWPGVTVEKKEGKLRGHSDVIVQDLPGIYSLSPYTLEEVVSRKYLVGEKPDAILNIVDGTNIERNLYLTTQLIELGIPVLVAVNMMDLVRKNGDKLNLTKLSERLGCPVVEMSALKSEGCMQAAEAALALAEGKKQVEEQPHVFTGSVEHAIAHIEESIQGHVEPRFLRWYAIKLFERDSKVQEELNLPADLMAHLEQHIADCEAELDDDAESIVTNQRYAYINKVMDGAIQKAAAAHSMSTSDKIDSIVTNRILALPIFALVMWLVYYISVTTVGTIGTDWANDGVFGDGWHLFGIGTSAYEEAAEPYGDAMNVINAFVEADGSEALAAAIDSESEEYDGAAAVAAVNEFAATVAPDATADYTLEDEETLATEDVTYTGKELAKAAKTFAEYNGEEPDPADYGIWVPGIPVLVGSLLESMNCGEVLSGLILDGIIAGVGAVLGFVPQMLVLFLFLAFLEECGYMARIAFIMDRIFRRFGLSGKSFIPILIGTGCGVPGIMASRTIENDRDRKMTIMTTTFIPCGAKLPFIAMVAGAIFGGASWVAPSAYFLGIAAIICSGIILKKTKLFVGDPAPFVMELPAYHMPTVGAILRSMWERGSSFIKKAGTIILLSTIVVWFTTYFGFVNGSFGMLAEDQMDSSILGTIGGALAWIFAPLGFGNWQATVASITGLVAKENIVGTMGILYSAGEGTVYANMAATFTLASGYAFLAFNLLCAPCFAAMGAIKREMNNAKWFWTAIGYQCGFAWLVGLVVNQLGSLALYGQFGVFTVIAVLVVIAFFYFLLRPAKKMQGKGKSVTAVEANT